VREIRIEGETVLERTLRAVMIGDVVSLRLAALGGADPTDVSVISDFKKRLDSRLQKMVLFKN
jgi:hypothetical protein